MLGRHDQAFSTRARAEQIRAEIEQLVADGRDILIDFEGVRSVSYSFADELIGVFGSHYEADHQTLRPVVIGLSAQAQRVVLSEVIALQRLHLQLDGDEPEVCIRRAVVRERIEPPKSKHGRPEVRLPAPLVTQLRVHLAAQPDQDSTALAFPSESGSALDPNNLRRRVLKPLVASRRDCPLYLDLVGAGAIQLSVEVAD